MATDYDQPRDSEAVKAEEAASLEALRAWSVSTTVLLDVDDSNLLEDLELPGADLSAESLVVAIVPTQTDEFRCQRCFLIVHKSQRAEPGADVCRDCAQPGSAHDSSTVHAATVHLAPDEPGCDEVPTGGPGLRGG